MACARVSDKRPRSAMAPLIFLMLPFVAAVRMQRPGDFERDLAGFFAVSRWSFLIVVGPLLGMLAYGLYHSPQVPLLLRLLWARAKELAGYRVSSRELTAELVAVAKRYQKAAAAAARAERRSGGGGAAAAGGGGAAAAGGGGAAAAGGSGAAAAGGRRSGADW